MTPLYLVASLPAGIVLIHGAWWTFLSVLALASPRQPRPAANRWRFVVVVPAHNEEAGIADCIASLRAACFEPEPEILVVADNCTDNTAEVALGAGAKVLVRNSDAERGKSYALDHAINHLAQRETPPDAVLFVDADTRVSRSLYDAIATALNDGAQAVQVHYAADQGEGTLPALRRLALGLVHWSRPLGASRLGLGTGLKGNGMALTWAVAEKGLGATGIAEDAAMTLDLAERGIPVRFAPTATVWGEMAADYEQAATQDRRWEGGRFSLIPRALRAAGSATLRGRLPAAAGALEVASLPLSALGALALGALALGAAGLGSLTLALAATASLATYIAVGLAAARPRAADLLALRAAPRFFLYKLSVFAGLLRRRQTTWERTGRRAP